MNNKRILVVGILAAIVTMMVGYALFSQNITINGIATAKGDFSLETTCQTGVPDSIRTAVEGDLGTQIKEAGYENDSCTVNGNKVSMNVNLKYPGAVRFFTIKVKNTGSIAFTLDVSEHDDGMSKTFEEMCIFIDDEERCTSFPLSDSDDVLISAVLDGDDYARIIAYEDIDGKIWSEENFDDITDDEAAKILDLETGGLRTGASIYLYMYIGIDDRLGNDNWINLENSLNFKYTANYELYFSQPTN